MPTPPTSEANPPTPSSESTPAQSTTGLTVSLPANPSLTNAAPSNTACLLKTAVAMVRFKDYQCRAHILFDEGAQRSFITEQLASSLHITPSKSQVIHISAFGGGTTPKELHLTSISLLTNDGGEVPMSVLVIPKIAAPLQNLIPCPGDHFPYLRDLPLAHPVQATGKFEISLLVGADFYWHIVQDRVIRGNGPTTVESKIGYLLSGPLSPHSNVDTVEALHVGITAFQEASDTKQFWNVEFTGTIPKSTASLTNDQRIADYINSSIRHQADGSYVVKFALVLHTFVDASLKAYGAVVFICSNTTSSFVMAKARVAPRKNLTLPRLELMAALVGARLCSLILSSLSHLHLQQVFMWSDSQIALHWILSEKRLPTFVTNRVQEIHKLLPDATWQYCPTKSNPADLVTRGISFHALHNSDLWKQGPSWITDRTQWPKWKYGEVLHIQTTDESTEDTTTADDPMPQTNINQVIDINRYSSWSKLLRVTAYVLRFIYNCKQTTPNLKHSQPLTPSEIDEATYLWIHHTQQFCFPQEFLALKSNKAAKHRLPLIRQLKLFLNNRQLICCGGRIHNAHINSEAKFPYLLPKKHPITSLIVYHVHKTCLHSGVNATATALRQRYWLPSTRQVVKSLLRKCVRCRQVAGKPYPRPDPPPLPSVRVKEARPFEITGVDFTGALHVKEVGDSKVYVCLFTCGVTRAVHLEIVNDLSVEMFLQALRRFAARRSLPHILISDNASTFEAAAKDLEELISSTQMSESLCTLGIQWRFIPKRAPWYGGFWKRLIGLTKMTLRKVLGKAFVTLPMLQTLIVEIEAVLNDRPLTYASSDLNDPEPLTPSHLICGRRITSLPHRIVDETVDPTYGAPPVKETAKRLSQLLQHFQSRWRREYLTSLREYHRSAGSGNKQTVKVGDVVIVHDDAPRAQWKLAIVERLIFGSDDLARAAEIRTAGGKTNRPIARLIPLEVNVNDEAQNEQLKATHATNDSISDSSNNPVERPTRQATIMARNRLKQWAEMIHAAPEDVMD